MVASDSKQAIFDVVDSYVSEAQGTPRAAQSDILDSISELSDIS